MSVELDIPVTVTSIDVTQQLSAAVDSRGAAGRRQEVYPDALVAGFGADLTVLKGVGHPRALTDSWGLARRPGWQGVGHTRMATESAVTPSGATRMPSGPTSAWCTTDPSPTTPPSAAN